MESVMHEKSPRHGAASGPDSLEARRNTPSKEAQDLAAEDLDELDRGIVHALQIHPRAPWTLVGGRTRSQPGDGPLGVGIGWRRRAWRG